MTDWRLTNQKEYLYGEQLIKGVFQETENNDHEHCAFCWIKIDKTNNTGYCTTNRYYWICKKCFQDFQEEFAWKICQSDSEW